MRSFTVQLKEEYPFLKGGSLEGLLADYPFDGGREKLPDWWTGGRTWKRPAVVVVPGGGYGMTSKREGAPVAAAFFAKGFQVFILNYLCRPQGVRYPEELLELASAVDYVRKNAAEFDVDPNEIFVVGFSAGGHLTGNLAVEYATVSQKAGTKLDCKPTAVGLCYPVISQIHGHQGSYDNLLAEYSEEEKQKLYPILNLNEAVTKDTPPAFIWTTATDGTVPADNALRYALALADNGVSYELHVYPHGVHGISTGNKEINAPNPELVRIARWVDDCASYFRLFTEEEF